MSDTEKSSSIDVQQLAYLVQFLENQQRAISEQLDILESQTRGVLISKSSMEGLKETQTDHEIIIPVGSNAFTKARLVDPNRIIISISNDILIERTLDEGIANMDRLLESYDNLRKRLEQQLMEVTDKLSQLRSDLEKVYPYTNGNPSAQS